MNKDAVAVVEWLDAVSKENSNLEEVIREGLSPTENVGFLLHQDKEFVILCHRRNNDVSINEDDDEDSFIAIPSKSIVKITVYKKTKTKRRK